MFDVWKNVLAKVEQAIPASAFTTWFSDVVLVSIEDGVVTVGVPNVFKVKQLEKKFDGLIRGALKDNSVEFDNVVYVVSSKNSRVKKHSMEVRDRRSAPQKISEVDTKKVFTNTLNTGLNPKYTMDNFIIGSNNMLAVAVAKNIIDKPGERYNPFFLYGGSGLGKTHLVQAIGNELLRKNPKMNILYTSTTDFFSGFIQALQNKTTDQFTKKYRKLDVLIIDDFQMIIGKDASQVEFFNIFNDLSQRGKQIIVTSDRLPDQIKTVDVRLSSRLSSAGTYDLQLPSFEDRCAILKSKAEFMGLEIEDCAIEYLAENVKTNVRDLEGEFSKLMAISELRGVTPLEIINSGYTHSNSTSQRRARLVPRNIVEKVAKFYDLTVEEMCGKSRIAHIKTARQVAMYLLTEEMGLSTTKIALEVGVKDHTTVMHGVKKIREDLKLDFTLREQIQQIREALYE